MSKWIWKLYSEDTGLWKEIFFLSTLAPWIFSLAWVKGDPSSGIMYIKLSSTKLGARHSIGNGHHSLFWSNYCLGQTPIKDHFLTLFSICSEPRVIVHNVFSDDGGQLQFHRSFGLTDLVQWDDTAAEYPSGDWSLVMGPKPEPATGDEIPVTGPEWLVMGLI